MPLNVCGCVCVCVCVCVFVHTNVCLFKAKSTEQLSPVTEVSAEPSAMSVDHMKDTVSFAHSVNVAVSK